MKAPCVGRWMSGEVWLRLSSIAAVTILAVNLLAASYFSDRSHQSPAQTSTMSVIADLLDSASGYFIENRGQVNKLVKYYSTGNPSVAFRDDGVLFVAKDFNKGGVKVALKEPSSRFASADIAVVKSYARMLSFVGSNKPSPVGLDRLSFNSSFFNGNDPDKWRTGVPSYGVVIYYNLYDGIDLVYRQNAIGLKYEFVVKPGANPRAIRINVEGADSLRLEDNDIVVESGIGEVRDSRPYSYDGDGTSIECRFITYGPTTYGFNCDGWDTSKQLVIDPLVYSTFLGGGGDDDGWSIAVDSDGNAYVYGMTSSTDFPAVPGSFDLTLNGSTDMYVAKLNPTGNSLVYCTYMGGGNIESGGAIAIDPAGNAYLTGSTSSVDFPTTSGAYDVSFNINGQEEAYVAALNATGSGLIYSTFVGGSGSERGRDIALDSDGNAYVIGDTDSTDFPTTPGAYKTALSGPADAFVLKLDPTGSSLVYSSYMGGNGGETGYSIALDLAGDAYVTGITSSTNYPVTVGAFQMSFKGGPYDVYVTKLNGTGTGLVYSTYLGGTGTDTAPALAVDSLGSAFVAGTTDSADFPVTPGSFNTTLNGSFEVFVVKLDPAGTGLIYSTFLGGKRDDWAGSIMLGPAENAYLVGDTQSANFPVTQDAEDRWFNGISDVFVTVLNATGSGLAYSTFLGGFSADFGLSIAMNPLNDIYITGFTNSADFPAIFGCIDPTYNGNGDAYVTRISALNPVDLPDLDVSTPDVDFLPPGPVLADSLVTVDAIVHNIGKANASQVVVRFYDGPPPSSPRIGVDQVIPAIQRLGGNDTASVVWMAGSTGSHYICVLADPDNAIVEESEFNNVACATIEVLSPPDLIPRDLNVTPSPPILEGTMSQINVTVSNEGDMPAGTFGVLLFDDRNGNKNPDAGEQINMSFSSGISGNSQSGFMFDWNATPTGLHSICAYADPPPGTVTESNETNNVVCIDIFVQPGPVLRPDYVPVSPLPLPPIRVGMSSPVSLSIEVLNQGNGTATDNAIVAFREQSSTPFLASVVDPLAPAANSARFTASWTSPASPGTYSVSVDVDYYNNVSEWDETNNVYTWTIEVVSGPLTSLVVGYPNYTSPAMATYVKSTTPLSLSVLDQSALGIRNTTYTIDGGNPINYTATGTFFLTAEGEHTVEWRSLDWAGNLEELNSKVLRVDDTPPTTAILIGELKHLIGGTFVNSSTPLSISAVDGGVGSNSTFFRFWGGTWSSWRDYSSSFSLAGRDGTWYVEYLSYDYLGNVESVQNETVILDNTPPVTTISPAAGPYTTATVFTLTATDSGCGVNITRYRIDGGSWTVYANGFTLPEGVHNISYYSNDMLNNTEAERWLVVTVEGTTTPPEVAVNYKPIVALVFAIILLVAGIWSSRKRPWNGGKERMAVVKAFILTPMPFVVAEAVTGVISFLTGELGIPPVVGVGMAVDCTILILGLVVLVARAMKKKTGTEEAPAI